MRFHFEVIETVVLGALVACVLAVAVMLDNQETPMQVCQSHGYSFGTCHHILNR